MGRLADKFNKARDAVLSVEMQAEKDVDAVLARAQNVDKRRQDVFMKVHTRMDNHMTDLAELEKDFEALNLSNGGERPLDGGEDTSTADRKAWQPPKE
jgi:hypothetical protein